MPTNEMERTVDSRLGSSDRRGPLASMTPHRWRWFVLWAMLVVLAAYSFAGKVQADRGRARVARQLAGVASQVSQLRNELAARDLRIEQLTEQLVGAGITPAPVPTPSSESRIVNRESRSTTPGRPGPSGPQGPSGPPGPTATPMPTASPTSTPCTPAPVPVCPPVPLP